MELFDSDDFRGNWLQDSSRRCFSLCFCCKLLWVHSFLLILFDELENNKCFHSEIVEWTGFAIATWSFAGLAFAIFTFSNIGPRFYSASSFYLSNLITLRIGVFNIIKDILNDLRTIRKKERQSFLSFGNFRDHNKNTEMVFSSNKIKFKDQNGNKTLHIYCIFHHKRANKRFKKKP
jgi:hypothetical protein